MLRAEFLLAAFEFHFLFAPKRFRSNWLIRREPRAVKSTDRQHNILIFFYIMFILAYIAGLLMP